MPTFTSATSCEDFKNTSPGTKTQKAQGLAGLPHAVHGREEFAVRLRELELVEQELHRLHGVQLGEGLAQEPDLLELVLLEEQLFLARARLLDVDRREDALVHEPTVQVDLHVARALELLEDHVVHPATPVDDGSRHDRERDAFFDIARGRKEASR